MRSLSENETKIIFEKLYSFIGPNIQAIFQRDDESYCFRLQNTNLYYVREAIVRRASCISMENLVALGQCVGTFSNSGNFRLPIGALNLIAQHAKFKVWLKPSA